MRPIFLLLFLFVSAFPVLAQTIPAQNAAAPSPGNPAAAIESFNQRLAAATRSMDNAATLALWADDGITLLPSTEPVIGKSAIAAFLTQATAGLEGAHMDKFELECHDLVVSGDLATEWCTEHQIVVIPNKPTFDGRGKMLLVLHRTPTGQWLLQREMWNQA